MKSERGKPVFVDDVNAVLTEKIVEHTKKNADSRFKKNDPLYSAPPYRKECCMNISRSKCITAGIVAVLFLVGLAAYFIFRTKCFRRKK